MKKKCLFFALSFLFVCACSLFAGCTTSTNKYEIIVKANGYYLGSVEGGNDTYSEGEKVTIKAVPITTNSKESKFFCWLLNDKVVSTEKEHSFVVSKDTAGVYVALFTCQYLEYFALDEITLNSGITSDIRNTYVTQIKIYLGTVENDLTNVWSTASEISDSQTIFNNDDLYQEDPLPYAYNIQNDIFIKIEVTYVQDEIEFVSTTNAKINKNNDVTKDNVGLENVVLSLGVNLENEDLKMKTDKDNVAKISFKFKRLSEFELSTNVTEEE